MMNDEEKEHTAYHEGGHAVCAYVHEHADPVHKVTILPTGMALGMTQQLPEEERYSHDKNFLEDMLSVFMGGRVAEDIVFGSQSTGASNDLVARHRGCPQHGARVGHERAHRPDGVGLARCGVPRRGPRAPRDYSDETARVIDEEVELILREQGGAHAASCSPSTAPASTPSPTGCSNARRSTAKKSPDSSTRRWATRPAVRARSCTPTARSPSPTSTSRARSKNHSRPAASNHLFAA